MRLVVFLIFNGVFSLACGVDSTNFAKATQKEKVPTTAQTTGAGQCPEKGYKHRTERELAALTPEQILDESVKEALCHQPSAEDDYQILVNRHIQLKGLKVLPVLVEYMDAYEPKKASVHDEMRFHVAFQVADSLDNSVVRMRGINEGRQLIESFERATLRLKDAGDNKTKLKNTNDFAFVAGYLAALKGVNARDGFIKNTLRVQHQIQISDKELSDFGNYLVSLDPMYPSWSEVSTEFSPNGLLKDSKRYHQEYLKFKAGHKP